MPLTADDIDALYRSHARAMVTFLARRTLDAEAAVDLVAETFAVAIVERERCRASDADARAAWLFGIARNHLHGWHRRGAVERRALEKVGIERPPLVDADIERLEDLAALHALRGLVAELIEQLSFDVRETLRLRVVEELSYEETARTLDISEQTARARVSRALRTLAAQLESEPGLMERRHA